MSTLMVRKLHVDLSRGFKRYWMGDAYRTAFMNALSMCFPIGEQMFIDSVRAVPQDEIEDPKLRAEVRDFVGQEATHRHIHKLYNDQLLGQGYAYTLEPVMEVRMARIARLPVLHRLAITSALEHYTAIMADFLLTHPDFMADVDPQMRTVWSWHAVEEIEHKAVVFDLYQAVGGGYWRRALWYVQVSLMFWIDTLRQTHHNLARDGKRFKWSTFAGAARMWFGRGGLFLSLLGPALSYLSPRFHPWRHDNSALLRSWLAHNEGKWRDIGTTPARHRAEP